MKEIDLDPLALLTLIFSQYNSLIFFLSICEETHNQSIDWNISVIEIILVF